MRCRSFVLLLGIGSACGSEPAADGGTAEGESEEAASSSDESEGSTAADMGPDCPPKEASVQIEFVDFESEGLNVQEACSVVSATDDGTTTTLAIECSAGVGTVGLIVEPPLEHGLVVDDFVLATLRFEHPFYGVREVSLDDEQGWLLTALVQAGEPYEQVVRGETLSLGEPTCAPETGSLVPHVTQRAELLQTPEVGDAIAYDPYAFYPDTSIGGQSASLWVGMAERVLDDGGAPDTPDGSYAVLYRRN